MAAELDGAGERAARYVYGTRAHVPNYVVRADGLYRLVTDQLGSVRGVVNVASGAVVQRMDYDAWGKLTRDTNPGFQSLGYAGGLMDRATGLIRFGARDYDPRVGRWTCKDPIRFDAGGTNLYAYCYDRPIGVIDPSGTDVWPEGPSGDEPPHHESINVGDPNGYYESFSFGTDVSFLEAIIGTNLGYVYPDPVHGGNIATCRYRKTTLLEDRAIRNYLRGYLGEAGYYSLLLRRTCIDWTADRWDAIVRQGLGTPTTPPRPYDPSLKPGGRGPTSRR